MDPLVVEEALLGTPKDQSPTFMIRDVLGTLAQGAEIVESPVAEEEEESSSSTPGNNVDAGDGTDGEEQIENSPEK